MTAGRRSYDDSDDSDGPVLVSHNVFLRCAKCTKNDRKRRDKQYMSIARSLMKSQCSGFSTSTTPHGYMRPLTRRDLTSITVFDPITANGTAACDTEKQSKIRYVTMTRSRPFMWS